MDEIGLFGELRPAPPDNAAEIREAARTRLSEAMSVSAGRPARGRPWGRPRFWPLRRRSLFLVAAVAACAAIIVPLVGAGPTAHPGGKAVTITTAAWTVRRAPNGTIAVSVRQLKDPAGLEKTLRTEGVPAFVRYVPYVELKPGSPVTGYPACSYDPPHPRMAPSAFSKIISFGPAAAEIKGTISFIIHPAAIPPGTAVFIEVNSSPRTPGPGGVSEFGSQTMIIFDGPLGPCRSNAP